MFQRVYTFHYAGYFDDLAYATMFIAFSDAVTEGVRCGQPGDPI